MPLLSKAGYVAKKFYVCLQEQNGKFGPRIQKIIEENIPSNLCFEASKSGKMEKRHMTTFKNEILAPEVKKKSLLLLDSWGGQTNPEKIKLHNKTVILENIPNCY